MMDDEFELDAPEIYMSMTFDVRIIRVVERTLLPAKLTVRTDINAEDMGAVATTAAILRIRLWIDNVVNNAIAFSPENIEAYGMFFDAEGAPRTNNTIMLTPNDPSDDVLAMTFQAKFQAIAGDALNFEICEVSSENRLGLKFTFVGDPAVLLPEMDAWVGPRSYFDQPWWHRDDASCYDMVPPEDADLSVKPAWARPIVSGLEAALEEAPKTQSMILRPNFKPKVIDGGKKPETDPDE